MQIAVRDLTASYGGTNVLQGVAGEFAPGITGLLGPNGAGKTTYLNCLATVGRTTTGTIGYQSRGGQAVTTVAEIRRHLGFMPQHPGFFPNYSVSKFLDYVAVLKGFTDRRVRRRMVGESLDKVQLTGQAKKSIKSLSGGMRQRAGLACALIGNPSFLILDEPTVGLDPQQRANFRQVLSDVGRETTVILSTHQTEDVAALCSRVVVLDSGRVRFDGATADLAQLAHGRVWESNSPSRNAVASWATAQGTHRNIGISEPGEALVAPTTEDGYLWLLSTGTHTERR